MSVKKNSSTGQSVCRLAILKKKINKQEYGNDALPIFLQLCRQSHRPRSKKRAYSMGKEPYTHSYYKAYEASKLGFGKFFS